MHGELRPLGGITVLDLTRMLPGAILARQLLDLGARVVKVEDPAGGDPFRLAPPLVEGVGAGFALCYRGARSVALDLKRPEHARALARLARTADVLVESFRTGRMESWGLGAVSLIEANPRLVYCSLSACGRTGPEADAVAHDLDATARTGALRAMGAEPLPRIQLADVGTALLACSAVLAALLARERTGRGAVLDQPLVTGPLPFVSWLMAEAAAGGPGTVGLLLAGRCPCYRTYRCRDGEEIAVGAIEPRLWAGFLEMLDLTGLEDAGYDPGEAGAEAARRIQAALERHPRHHWLREASRRGLPLSPVASPAEAVRDPLWAGLGLAPAPGAPPTRWFPAPVAGPTSGEVPSVGQHNHEFLESRPA